MTESAFSSTLAYWARALATCVSQDLATRLAPKGVTVAEWTMLAVLYEQDPIAPSRLAYQMGLTRGAITKLVDRLIKKTLVSRSANKNNRQNQTVTLTRKGIKLIPELKELALETELQFFRPINYREKDELLRLMKCLAETPAE